MNMFPYVVPLDNATALLLPVTLLKNGHQLAWPLAAYVAAVRLVRERVRVEPGDAVALDWFRDGMRAPATRPVGGGQDSTSARARCRVKSWTDK